MGSSLPLGTIFGVHVRLDGTLLLLFVVFGFQGFDAGGLYGVVNALVFLVFLLVSIVLHEIGHAAAGLLFGLRPVEIALQFFGGYTRYAEPPRNPLEEAVVSLAGPLVNLALAALLYVALAHGGGTALSAPTARLLDNLRYANLILGIFNLLPAFPLDGGSFTRAILSLWLSRALARLIVAGLGLLLGVALAVYAFTNGITFTGVVGILLALIAWQELTAARAEL